MILLGMASLAMMLAVLSHAQVILSLPKTSEPARGEDIAVRIGLFIIFAATAALLALWLFQVPRSSTFMVYFSAIYTVGGASTTTGFVMMARRAKQNRPLWAHHHPFLFHRPKNKDR